MLLYFIYFCFYYLIVVTQHLSLFKILPWTAGRIGALTSTFDKDQLSEIPKRSSLLTLVNFNVHLVSIYPW